MELNVLELDPKAESAGVWKPLGIGDIEVKLRSPNSADYLDEEDRQFATVRELYGNDLPPRRRIEAKAKAIVNAGLVDWKNIVIDGEEVAFDPTRAVELFTGTRYKQLREALVVVFQQVDVFLKQSRQDKEGNLRLATGGS